MIRAGTVFTFPNMIQKQGLHPLCILKTAFRFLLLCVFALELEIMQYCWQLQEETGREETVVIPLRKYNNNMEWTKGQSDICLVLGYSTFSIFNFTFCKCEIEYKKTTAATKWLNETREKMSGRLAETLLLTRPSWQDDFSPAEWSIYRKLVVRL